MARRTYSYSELSRKLEDSIAWRRKELKIINDRIPDAPGPKQNAALRSALPILYAHWEGFVKNCCELYLEYVACKYLKHNELQPQFIALSLSKRLGYMAVNNLEEKTEHISFLIDEYNKQSNIQTKGIIQTKSNLRFSVFEEILFAINIDKNTFDHYRSLINDLVDTRNHIAHGDYLKVNHPTFIEMSKDVQIVMESLKTEIENSAIQEKYKK